MKNMFALLFFAIVLPNAASAEEVVEPDPNLLIGQIYGGLEQFLNGQEQALPALARKDKIGFASELRFAANVCISEYKVYGCSDYEAEVDGFDIEVVRCRSLKEDPPAADGRGPYEFCQSLIRRQSDNTAMACIYVKGFFGGQTHLPSYRSQVAMHIDEAGNWKFGKSPKAIEAVARARAEDERRSAAGEIVPATTGYPNSNMRCSRDVNEFLEIEES